MSARARAGGLRRRRDEDGGDASRREPSDATPAESERCPVGPRPADPMSLTKKAGLTPETHEFVFLHVHAAPRRLRERRADRACPRARNRHREPCRPAPQGDQAAHSDTGASSPPCAAPVIVAAAHPLRRWRAPHRGQAEPVRTARRVLHGMGASCSTPTCVGGYCGRGAHHDLRRRRTPQRGDPRQIDARGPVGRSDRDRVAARQIPLDCATAL